MIFFFSSGESIEVSPVEPMISTALVPELLLEAEQGLERREIDRAVLVERRDQRDERACDFLFGHAVSPKLSHSLPLVGRVGWGVGR